VVPPGVSVDADNDRYAQRFAHGNAFGQPVRVDLGLLFGLNHGADEELGDERSPVA